MTNPKRPETVEEISARTLVRHAEAIAERLRRVAQRIEGVASRVERVGQPGVVSYASIASDIQGEFRAMLGNLMLEQLVMDACDADRARQRRIAAEVIAAQIDAKAERMRTGDGATPTGFAMGAVVAEGAIIAREYAAKEG